MDLLQNENKTVLTFYLFCFISATNTRNKAIDIKAAGIPSTSLIILIKLIIIELEQLKHILDKDKEQNLQLQLRIDHRHICQLNSH